MGRLSSSPTVCKLLLFSSAILLLVLLVLSLGRPGPALDSLLSSVDAQSNVREKIGLSSHGTAPRKLKRPNIIFMMADDVGYGDVHYSGGNADTPNLDAMAAGPNSIHLTRYYAGAPHCSPTRGTVLTGRNHNRYCIWKAGSEYPLPTTEISIAQILREQGYHTSVFGKWHIGALRPGKRQVSDPSMFGFDHWWVTPSSAPTFKPNCVCFDQSRKHCPIGHYGTPIDHCENYHAINPNSSILRGWPEPIQGDDSQFMLERLSDFLQTVSKTNRPFFVYFPFHAVHIPFLANAKYQKLYLARGYSLEEADYYGAISAMDEVVGQVQALLHRHNIYDDTMVYK